jgi:hypothetical protein
MLGGASGRRDERRGDTVIAAAVLVLLLVGWIEGLGAAKLEMLWALRSYLVANAHASAPVR